MGSSDNSSEARFYSKEQGSLLVRAARDAIEGCILSPNFRKEHVESTLKHFKKDRHGVFVTIAHYPNGVLRGCIGFIQPSDAMDRVLVDAAISAATEDPRFVSLTHMEFEHMVITVSILTEPERFHLKKPSDARSEIRLGKDGIIVRYGHHSGIFLPSVPIEEGWGVDEYLDNACIKAGLPPQAWKNPGIQLYRFRSQVFEEVSPAGEIREVENEAL